MGSGGGLIGTALAAPGGIGPASLDRVARVNVESVMLVSAQSICHFQAHGWLLARIGAVDRHPDVYHKLVDCAKNAGADLLMPRARTSF